MNNPFSSIKFKPQSHGVRLPEIKNNGKSSSEYLREIAYKGYWERVNDGLIIDSPLYHERLEMELAAFDKTYFTDYIILVADVTQFCLKNDIPTGTGRGSAAGSLVLYCTKSTDVEPVKGELFFERFISMARAKSIIIDGVRYIDASAVPDFDYDLDFERRQEVVEYLKSEYPNRVCKVTTHQTYQSRVAMKSVAKLVLGVSEEKAKQISKMIPSVYGKIHSIPKARQDSPEFEEYCEKNPLVYEIALKIHNLVNASSSHASAFLVSYEDLNTKMPLYIDAHGERVSFYDMKYAQKDTIKLDLLGLKSTTLIDKICKRIGVKPQKLDIESYNKVYKHLQKLKVPFGLFQISGDCNYRVVQEIKPKNISGLSAVVAIARPGALAYCSDYAAFSNEGKVKPVHEFFADILGVTGGLPLYQEQAMAMGRKIGFSLEEADQLRRMMGKKLPAEMKLWEEKVYAMCEKNNVEKSAADALWKVLEESANYSFNKSHSLCYAVLAAQTTYLKFNHPLEFFTECFNMALENAKTLKEISIIEDELQYFGIKLLPPSLTKSKPLFCIEDGNIRYGLSAIKNLRGSAIDHVGQFVQLTADKERKITKFEIFQAAINFKIDVGSFSSLIQTGVLSEFGDNRPKLVYEFNLWKALTPKECLYCMKNGEKEGYKLIKMVKGLESWVDEKGKPVAAKTRMNTIRKKMGKQLEIYQLNSANPLLANFAYERELLGYCNSVALKNCFNCAYAKDSQQIKKLKEKTQFDFVGMVVSAEQKLSKKDDNYIRVVCRDNVGFTTFMLYGHSCNNFLDSGQKIPAEGAFVFIHGAKGNGDISWANEMHVQEAAIYIKYMDLSRKKEKDKKAAEKNAAESNIPLDNEQNPE